MQPQDVFRLTGVSDPRLSPDATAIAYTVWRADRESNSYPTAIHINDAKGSRQLTDGEKSDGQPRWSPDGTKIAFVSNRGEDDKAPSALYVIDVAGDDPIKLTDLKEDVGNIEWSPDGLSLLFTCRERDEAYAEEDDKARSPRRFTRLRYRLDNVGWTLDRSQHIFTVAADGSGEPQAITKAEYDDDQPQWSPDGTRIAFAGARHEDWDIDPVQDILVVDADGGETTMVTGFDGWCQFPSWSPDGTRIAYQYTPGRFDDPRHGQIAVVDLATGARTILTASLDRNCSAYPPIREPLWDGENILFAVEDGGNTHLYRVASDGSREPELVVGGELNVTGYDQVGGRLVYTATDLVNLPELFEDGTPLTDATSGFASSVGAIPTERFEVTSADGHQVDAWILKPDGFEAGKTYPVLLNIHGGPFTQYGNRFFDEFQVFARAGYVVLFSNPRGSSGYSETDARAIRGPIADGPGWGTVDYEDLMAVVDTALDLFDFCDPDRLGVLGGSYGGFMTSWITGHTDRFKAACSERAVNNWYSMHGSSDLGWIFKGYFGAFAFEEGALDAFMKHSPITYVDKIDTPMLILHSESDLRCPIEQAEQLFTALRLLKRDVEFVRFPAEGHELSRFGSPRHRAQRFEIIVDWFDRKLKG
jgi:dipeptidyl aminopeptidase/acylaminoacyl peptidase